MIHLLAGRCGKMVLVSRSAVWRAVASLGVSHAEFKHRLPVRYVFQSHSLHRTDCAGHPEVMEPGTELAIFLTSTRDRKVCTSSSLSAHCRLVVAPRPLGVGTRITYNDIALKAGMTLSNGAVPTALDLVLL